MKITSSFHGAVLDDRHGTVTADGLRVTVSGQAPWNAVVTVNGEPATLVAGQFTCEVLLSSEETDIVAVGSSPTGQQQHAIRVVWDRHSFPRYRFSIDDNLFCFRDIAKQQYSSLFDCFYLAMLKRLHNNYGTKFALNIFYTDKDGFDLSMFPDRYKSEWVANGDWLKLAFHSKSEFPDRPYMTGITRNLQRDYLQIEEQVLRFAGPETWSPSTCVHWAVLPDHCFPLLREYGVTTLSGFFMHLGGGHDVSYLLDPLRCEYLRHHEALRDFASGITFSKIDICCNSVTVADTIPWLEAIAADPMRSRIMDVFTHEQYSWPFYSNYIPDHEQRLDTTLRWLTEHGYQPVWFHEGLLGAPA